MNPADTWVHYNLGQLLEANRPSQAEEAMRAYAVARAVRPETAHQLAHALAARAGDDEAEAVFLDLTLRWPGNARHLTCFGVYLKERGRNLAARDVIVKAIAAAREALRIKPDVDGHLNLGAALYAQGDSDAAIAQYKTAIRLRPDYITAHRRLAVLLCSQGRLEEGIAEWQATIRLNPDFAAGHQYLGVALTVQGKPDEAIAEYREAIRLNPYLTVAHYNLGGLLLDEEKLEEAIFALRRAIQLEPGKAEAHTNLGIALRGRGNSTRRSPNTARRSGSNQTNPWPTPSSALPWVSGERENSTRRSSNTARRSGSNSKTRRCTTPSATSCELKES